MEINEFWLKVNKTSTCWLWTGRKDRDGYGRLYFKGHTSAGAHRVSYEFTKGKIPKELQIDHLCRNPICVNPAHLEVVTSQENTRRGFPATKKFCVNGHEFSEENTYLRKDNTGGVRGCRKCNLQAFYRHKEKVNRSAA